MKKIFTLIAAAILGFCGVQAQTITVNKTDGTKVTYNASEISSIEFAPKSDTTLIHEFTGYLLVSSKYFSNSYYGDSAKITVLQVGDQYLAKFSDATWGNGTFEIEMNRGQISGKGSIAMTAHGNTATYDATMSGAMTNIQISMPSVMGGTTINWIYGKVPQAYTIAGTYAGADSLNVGGQFPYFADGNPEYVINATSDSTIDVTVPAEEIKATVMGDLTLTSYTIKNIKWDADAQAFKHNYKNDNVTFHFTATNKDGVKTIDNDYTMGVKNGAVMDDDVCNITVTPAADGSVTITNSYKMGSMPFTITNTYVAKKK